MKQKKKKLSEKDMMLKAFRKANREIELERNGGHWTATTQTWKNKKAYNRKRDRKIDSNGLFDFYIYRLIIFSLSNYHSCTFNRKRWHFSI